MISSLAGENRKQSFSGVIALFETDIATTGLQYLNSSVVFFDR